MDRRDCSADRELWEPPDEREWRPWAEDKRAETGAGGEGQSVSHKARRRAAHMWGRCEALSGTSGMAWVPLLRRPRHTIVIHTGVETVQLSGAGSRRGGRTIVRRNS